MQRAAEGTGALRLTLEVWHPDCWVLETTAAVDVGLLSYGCYTRENGHATTLFTLYGDTNDRLDDALAVVRGSAAVDDVAEMTRDHRRVRTVRPGNAVRELLVDHDGTTQISEAFTDRGFVPAEPVDARGNTEYWTVVTGLDRERADAALDEVREAEAADIEVTSVTRADTGGTTPLPLDRLSSRQREVFRLARDRGYYAHPRRTDAAALAGELDVTTSTLHEHLRKIEATLLDGAVPSRGDP